ncbi:MAG: hypothetical protein EHM35_06350 [Planctomycetaceae bacterium]|nr:MAG: hypothetical protein EHM35_06350 [Planctomycetaceae bacterium]
MGAPSKVIERNRTDIKGLEEDLARTESDLEAIRKKFADLIVASEEDLAIEVMKAETPLRIAASTNSFVMDGWLPTAKVEALQASLNSLCCGLAFVETLPKEEGDEPPVLLKNPTPVKPFEFFMQLVRPPKYKEVDPSPLMAVFFPIFFGIMVGDVGYGLVIMALSLLVKARSKAKWLQSLANIMLISSVPTILFGLFFGEFFGDLGEHMHLMHPVELFGVTWNRMEAVIPMLILVIIIGALHVFLGLGIGLYNAYTVRSRKHMIEKIGTAAVLIGLGLCLAGAAAFAPGLALWAGLALLLVAIPMVFYGGGTSGVIELVSAVGNIMSYARLMAIGMASVVLAIVANQFAGAIGVAVIGIAAALLLHALNVVLGMFSPSIHALRLHMVEFFSKFYHGGGLLYKPFRKSEKES